MKKITTFALILTVLSFASCKKKSSAPTEPTSTPAPTSIDVQYRVTSSSGHFNVEYMSLVDGKAVATNVEVNKISFAYSFSWTTKQKLSIKAYNSTPSAEEVLVEIYVNGVLFKSASANARGASALAEGVYQ